MNASSSPRVFVLGYHSNNISGNDYLSNDHVALRQDLEFLRRHRVPVLRLSRVVDAILTNRFASLPARAACITFDDGSDYDYLSVNHPKWGPQEPMKDILAASPRGFTDILMGRRACATSFVIASPSARRQIAGDASDNPDRLSDEWWSAAQAEGVLDIGTHSWDHLHPEVAEVRQRPEVMEAFHKIDTKEEATLQTIDACRYVMSKTGSDRAGLFAYPWGQVSEYLAREFLPAQDTIRAAFTTDGVPITSGCDRWRLPRFVFGWHWKSQEDLTRLVKPH